MVGKSKVNLRERLKSAPSDIFVETYFSNKVEKDLEYNFDSEMQIHMAHGLMLVKQGIVPARDIKKILKLILKIQADGYRVLNIDYKLENIFLYYF